MQPTSHFFLGLNPSGFHRLHYVIWGDEKAERTVVCVHGMTRNSRDFDFLAQEIVRSLGARVAALDIAGRGDSDWLPDGAYYTYPQYLADVTAFFARLNCNRVDWIGTSMGARIGMLLAAQAQTPIQSLFMNDLGPSIPKAALERLTEYVGKAPIFANFDEVLAYTKKVHAPYGPLTGGQWHHLARCSARQNKDGSWRLAYDPAIGMNLELAVKQGVGDVWPLWDKVTVPSFLYRGMESDLLLPETVEKMRAKAKILEWPGIGHAPALMDKAQIDPIIDWLKSVA